jgi:hypothetical protein
MSTFIFDADATYAAAQGLNFIPTVRPPTWDQMKDDFYRFSRRIYCHDYFSQIDTSDNERDPSVSPKFRIPNPSWHPKTSGVDYEPSYGVEEYLAQTRVNVRGCIEDSIKLHATRPAYNMCRRHREALCKLLARRDVIFVDADKNLGLVCLDADDYVQRCIAELAQTHTALIEGDEDPLTATRSEIILLNQTYYDSLPSWAHDFLEALIERHPRTSAQYGLPFFRVTSKVHKSPPECRPITGNQRWITQPVAELVAELLQPYVTELPVWVKDTDQINRKLDELTIPADAFLLTYDIVRLYPSIPHELCYTLLREYLHERDCPYADFIVAALRIVLNRNYCLFDDKVYRQFIGFATGISCGG